LRAPGCERRSGLGDDGRYSHRCGGIVNALCNLSNSRGMYFSHLARRRLLGLVVYFEEKSLDKALKFDIM
jgi:hypothetical protein